MSKTKRLTYLTWVVILAIWFVITNTGLVRSVLVPSPQQVVSTFWILIQQGYNGTPLWQHILVSLRRIFLATALAVGLGVPLGLISGYRASVKAVVDSVIQFYRPLPPLAYYTLLVLWLGIDDASKVLLLFLAAFAPIYLAGVSAVAAVPEDYIRSAQSLGASSRQVFFRIVLPASLPQIFTGTRTAFGFAYTTLVASEMVAATSGMGWMVLDASKYLKSDVVVVGIIIMGLTGVVIDYAFKRLEQRVVFWKGRS